MIINPTLLEQLKDVVNNSENKEPVILIEQPGTYNDEEALRLIFVPETRSFIMGPNATIDGRMDNALLQPTYVRNIQEIHEGMFENQEVWLTYVTNLWTSHSLHSSFVKELDQSYQMCYGVQNILNSDEDVVVGATFQDGSQLIFTKEDKTLEHKQGDIVFGKVNLPEDNDLSIAHYIGFWQACVDAVEKKLSDAGELPKEEQVTTEELEDEFDLDNLYDGLEGNSSNPIDTSKPEEVEDVGCAGGACTL